jgi:hypothetical protein
VTAKAKKRRTRKPLSLTPDEVAKIDELIAQRERQETRQKTEWECQDIILQEERERQVLLREDHTVGPWPEPERLGPRTTLGDGDYVYVREGGEDEVPAGHPFLREVARRDGMIRYAWTGGLTIDLDQIWSKAPSWQFVMTRLKGVPANDWDRVIDKAIDDLFDTDIPLSQGTRQYLKEDRHTTRADLKRREHNRDRILAHCIAYELDRLVDLLHDAGFKDARTRAAEYLAGHWRKVVWQDRGRPRFSSGPALTAWLRRQPGPTKNTPKMSCQRGPSEHSDEG